MGARFMRISLVRVSAPLILFLVTLVTSSNAFADIDLLGRTQATFSWDASGGNVASYDVYLACGEGSAPDRFDAVPSTTVSGDSPSVDVTSPYGWQCKVRIVARSTDGRISALSLPSDRVNFIEPDAADNDFDGDGYSDIVIQDPDDGSALLMSGGEVQTGDEFLHTRTAISVNGTEDWEIVETGDFDGDGNPEFLWLVETYFESIDATAYAYIVGAPIGDRTLVLSSLANDQEIIAIADFDGNGSDDVLHRTNDLYGTIYVTFMSPSGVIQTAPYDGVLQSQFDFVACGDFDADGKDDVMWRRIESGQTVVWLMTRPGRLSLINSGVLPGANWHGETAGNFNNSSEHDVLWRNQNTGEVLIWYMDSVEAPEEFLLEAIMASNWSLLTSGDMDGDGRADLAWLNEDTNLLEVWRMDEHETDGFRID
ncbi:MAG: VCBS repeat-containing protein [bacterium]|nr:VCBS repeat-containing protein [bacterium]